MNLTSIADNFNLLGQSIKDMVIKPTQELENQRLITAASKAWVKSARRAIAHGADVNTYLKKLDGLPKEVRPIDLGGNLITSLEGAPKVIGDPLKDARITSLEGAPGEISPQSVTLTAVGTGSKPKIPGS